MNRTICLLILLTIGRHGFAISPSRDSLSVSFPQFSITPAPATAHPAGKKLRWLHKLEYKIALHRLNRHASDSAGRKNILSTVSLLSGIGAVILIFISPVAVAGLILAPIAIITGILGLSRHQPQTNSSHTKSVIGIVLGGLTILLVVIAAIVIAALFSGW